MMNSAIGGYAYDPYFMQAFSFPNYNQQLGQTQLKQQSQQVQTTTTNTSQTDTTTTGKPINFKGAAESIKEEKSSSTAKWILGTLATAGTIYLGYKCHGKGIGENWYSKIWDGAKQYWNKAVETVGKWTVKTNAVKPAEPLAISAGAETLALPTRWNGNYRGFEFSVEDGKVIKCIKNGVEYLFDDLPQAFRNNALKAIGLA